MPLPGGATAHTNAAPPDTEGTVQFHGRSQPGPLSHNDHSFSQTLFWCYPGKQCLKIHRCFQWKQCSKIIQRFHWKHCLKIHRHVRKTMCSLHSTPREDLTDFLFPVHAILSRDSDDDGGQDGFFFPGESHHNKEHAPHQHGQPECRGVNPI